MFIQISLNNTRQKTNLSAQKARRKSEAEEKNTPLDGSIVKREMFVYVSHFKHPEVCKNGS